MSKPIEWTREVKSTETTLIRTRLAVQQMDRYGSTIAVLAATPADLIAALAAMGEEEREKVMMEFNKISAATAADAVARVEALERSLARTEGARDELERTLDVVVSERSDALARAEKAERERDRMAAEFGCCPGELPDDGEIARIRRERDEARTELDRVRASLDVVRHDLAGTRQELGEARDKLSVRGVTADAFRAATDRAEAALRAERTACERAEKAERERDEALAASIAAQNRHIQAEKERDWERDRRADDRLEIDGLRASLKTALASRPPREYPLAEGSRWIDNVIRDADGSQSWLAGGQVVTDGPLTGGLRYTYRQSARDLAALLAKGGLL